MEKKRRIKGRSGRGTLMIVSLLLLGSGIIRLGTGAGSAIALEKMTEEPAAANESSSKAAPEEADLAKLLAALQKREAKVADREREMELRLQALSIADEQIEKKLTALEGAEERLRATLALADTAAEDDLSRLTTVYENMKPKDAAALFEAMDPDFAAGFLARMRSDAAAGIMAGLSPQAAYTISVILAGRNANVPKD